MKRLAQGFAIGALAGGLALTGASTGAFDRLEGTAWDFYARAHARPGPHTDRIRLVLLDQASLDWGTRENGWAWPWPREVYGAILDFCARAGARAVAFDILFTEPSFYGEADDAALAAAIRRGPPFVAALHDSGAAEAWPGQIPRNRLEVRGLDRYPRMRMRRALFPIPKAADGSRILGHVVGDPDAGGIFRRVGPLRLFDGTPVPLLGLALYEAGPVPWRIEPGRLTVPGGPGEPDRVIPIDSGGGALLRFRGPPGTHRSVSAHAVIRSELLSRDGEPPQIDPAFFRNCYVLLGFSAPGLMDLRPTPIAAVSPGVELHATALDNLLSDDFIRPVSPAEAAFWTLLFTCVAGGAVRMASRGWQAVLALAFTAPAPLAAGAIAYGAGSAFPAAAASAGTLASLAAALAVNFAVEGRQRRFVKQAFGRYLHPAVVERLLADPGQLRLGGEKRELTIFFSDLAGFSTLSERLDPEALTALLNDYLSEMTDLILEEEGTLDKYEGDAIVAFWGAPLAQEDHAARALAAAVRCQRRLAEKRPEWEARAGHPLRARIGLNTGEVVVGNLGSRQHFNYTVLGDAANLASRLEGANKMFGTGILVSEATWKAARERRNGLTGRYLGRIRVVGRSAPVRVFEPDYTGPAEPFAEGVGLCEAGRFREAISRFAAAGGEAAAAAYLAKCLALAEDPAAVWDGVWNLTEK